MAKKIKNNSTFRKDINIKTVETLKYHLKVESLSDSELSNVINWPHHNVKKLESGEKELTMKEIDSIHKAFGIHPDTLFSDIINIDDKDE